MIPVAVPGVGVELHRDPDSRSTAQVYEEQDMDGACLGSGATGVSPHPQRLGGVHEEAVRHAPEGSQTNKQTVAKVSVSVAEVSVSLAAS